jgi:hypothetical protein
MKKFWTYIKHKRKLSILGERLSGPCALYGLRFFSSFVIPFVVILNGFIERSHDNHTGNILKIS